MYSLCESSQEGERSGTQTLRDAASASIFISTFTHKDKVRLHKVPADRLAPIGRPRVRFSPVVERWARGRGADVGVEDDQVKPTSADDLS